MATENCNLISRVEIVYVVHKTNAKGWPSVFLCLGYQIARKVYVQ